MNHFIKNLSIQLFKRYVKIDFNLQCAMMAFTEILKKATYLTIMIYDTCSSKAILKAGTLKSLRAELKLEWIWRYKTSGGLCRNFMCSWRKRHILF